MKKLAILSILVFTFFLIPSALEAKVSDKPVIYVSAGSGFDNNPGTETRPFRSLAKAVDALAAGGTCYLMEGQYREKVLMKGLHGSADAPVLITAVPGAVVTFRGTKSIEELKAPGADWTRHDGRIYKLKLKEDIWQLFVNGQEMVPARWPNGFFNDSHPTVYSHESFGHCTTYTEVEEPIVGGDGDVVMNPGDILKDVNGNVVVRSKEEFPTDITGAIAIMNIGSWSTWARTITAQHSAKEFVFQPQIRERQIKRREQMFFLEGKLAFLDAPTEWFYDRNTKTLYLWTPDGEKPSGKIKGKVQSFAMTLGQCKYVTIKGIRFFGTTFTANECQHLVVEDCVFDFPHTSRRMLGEPATVNLTSINAKINQWSPSHCRVINCELRETDGPAIILGGYDNHIENCLFERIDWTGTTGHGYNIDVRNAPGLKFRRNTVRNTGGCEGVSCPRSVKTLEKNGDYEETEPWLTAPYVTYDDLFPTLIELNRLYDMGKVQSDGAHVDAGSYRIPGMMFRYNWAYRSDKNGLRFDGGGGWNNAPPGVEGTQHHNVVFGTRKLSCKGDRHFCFNNTCFDGSQQDIYVGGNYPRFNAFNSRSKVGNNACNTMSYSFNGENGKVPGELVSNFIGGLEGTDVKSLLVDVAQFDFRPRDMGGSGTGNANPLINKGTVEHGYTVKHFESFLAEEVMVPGPSGSGRVPSGNVLMFNEGITDGYKGSAPDIGAYEYDSDLYWIPGRKEKKASSPIPGDGAKDMPLGRDLIFLNGYRAQSADIYLGTDSMAVAKADKTQVEFLATKADPKNIVDPAKYGKHLKPNTKYFWRVDAVGENGTERGDLWSFTTGAVAVNAVETKPNIIFVMTDDQGYGDLACHGHPFLKTPNLDRLYEQSARFTDYHVSPTCSPTRAALMSGRIPFEVGITHTILERERMALGVPTVAEILQKAGYTTGIFGKWHLGEEDTYQPHMRGFDEVFIHGAGGIGQNYPGSQSDAPGTSYFNPMIRYNNVFEQTQGYCTDVFMRQALGWIKQNADKPFFAYIPFNAPHAPLKVEEKYKAMYRDKCSDQNVAAFLGMITNIDENMGLLMQKLDEWNLAENTLLIFSTDNGSSRGWVIFNAGMTGKKGSINRGGSRVPLFFRLPGLTKAGVDIDRLTRHIDIFPTLADLAGADISNLDLQGRSLLPLLKNPRVDWPDRYTVFHVGRWAKKGMETFVRYSGPADPDENNFIQSPVSKDPGRRDPSDIIKVGDVYYIWYTKGKLRHGYDATIWYATSPDGHTWTEKGEALVRGSVGRWDEQSVFTPSILVAEGKYWLYFTAVPKPFDEASTKSGIGMAVSDSPDGPWEKLAVNPILLTSDDPDKFDSMRVDDACLVVRDGKYWMYYKGRQIDKFPKNL